MIRETYVDGLERTEERDFGLKFHDLIISCAKECQVLLIIPCGVGPSLPRDALWQLWFIWDAREPFRGY
jgi:hypothetical protein